VDKLNERRRRLESDVERLNRSLQESKAELSRSEEGREGLRREAREATDKALALQGDLVEERR